MSSSQRYRVVFSPEDCVGFIEDNRVAQELAGRWFGCVTDRGLALNTVEISYLLVENQALIESGEELLANIGELMRCAPQCFKDNFWPQLVVYKDLRDRGRRVKVVSPGVFLVKDKTGTLKLVYVLEEKTNITGDYLIQSIERGRSNNMPVVFAIVSLQGDLTYYEASKIDLVKG